VERARSNRGSGAPATRVARSFARCAAALAAAACIALSASCDRSEPAIRVDSTRRLPEVRAPQKDVLRFAIGTMIAPREMVEGRQRLALWLADRLGRPVVVSQRATYGETNDLLVRGEVDFALVCSGAYASLPRKEIELIAAPATNGASTYHSLVIVRTDDPAQSFGELRRRRFAFVDALSLTGRLYPESLARADGHQPFFGEIVYTHSHTESIRLVKSARVEGAAVDSLVFAQMVRDEPELARSLRVLHTSPAFGSPPVVARRALPEAVRVALRKALLHMHEDAEGRALLVQLGFDAFVAVDDAAYDSVRDVCEHVQGEKVEEP
jgi:phosphonate transport system substrate-binding protein